MTSFFLQDVCCWSEGALDLMDDGDLCPVVDMRVGEMIFWHGCFIVNSWGKVLKCLHWFHLCSRTGQPVQSIAQEIFKMTMRLCRKLRGLFKRTCNLKTYYPSKLLSCMDNCFKVRINPNHPKSFKILYMLLYDFGGFRLVECSYHVFTWGLMSQFCLSTKNVPFGYCTV